MPNLLGSKITKQTQYLKPCILRVIKFVWLYKNKGCFQFPILNSSV